MPSRGCRPARRKALGTKLKQMGFDLPAEQLNEVFKRFKGLADKKKVGPGRRLCARGRTKPGRRMVWRRGPHESPRSTGPFLYGLTQGRTHHAGWWSSAKEWADPGLALEPAAFVPAPAPLPPLQSIGDEDVLALVNEEVHAPPTIITLVDLQVRERGCLCVCV